MKIIKFKNPTGKLPEPRREDKQKAASQSLYIYYPNGIMQYSDIQEYEDGTVTLYGNNYTVLTDENGNKYVDIVQGQYPIWDKIKGRTDLKGTYIARINIGNTIPYLKPNSYVQKSTNSDRRMSVPEKYREGLVKVDEEGNTYYEINASPRDILDLLSHIIRDLPHNYKYTNPEESKEEIVTEHRPSKSIENLENPKYTRTLTKRNDDAIYLYKYPYKKVNVYKLDPEVAHEIRSYFSNTDNSDKRYLFSTQPIDLTQFNDTVYHTLRPPVSDSEIAFSHNGIFDDITDYVSDVHTYMLKSGTHQPLIMPVDRLVHADMYGNGILGNFIDVGDNKVLYHPSSNYVDVINPTSNGLLYDLNKRIDTLDGAIIKSWSDEAKKYLHDKIESTSLNLRNNYFNR